MSSAPSVVSTASSVVSSDAPSPSEGVVVDYFSFLKPGDLKEDRIRFVLKAFTLIENREQFKPYNTHLTADKSTDLQGIVDKKATGITQWKFASFQSSIVVINALFPDIFPSINLETWSVAAYVGKTMDPMNGISSVLGLHMAISFSNATVQHFNDLDTLHKTFCQNLRDQYVELGHSLISYLLKADVNYRVKDPKDGGGERTENIRKIKLLAEKIQGIMNLIHSELRERMVTNFQKKNWIEWGISFIYTIPEVPDFEIAAPLEAALRVVIKKAGEILIPIHDHDRNSLPNQSKDSKDGRDELRQRSTNGSAAATPAQTTPAAARLNPPLTHLEKEIQRHQIEMEIFYTSTKEKYRSAAAKDEERRTERQMVKYVYTMMRGTSKDSKSDLRIDTSLPSSLPSPSPHSSARGSFSVNSATPPSSATASQPQTPFKRTNIDELMTAVDTLRSASDEQLGTQITTVDRLISNALADGDLDLSGEIRLQRAELEVLKAKQKNHSRHFAEAVLKAMDSWMTGVTGRLDAIERTLATKADSSALALKADSVAVAGKVSKDDLTAVEERLNQSIATKADSSALVLKADSVAVAGKVSKEDLTAVEERLNQSIATKADSSALALKADNVAVAGKVSKDDLTTAVEGLNRSLATKADSATVAGKASKDELGAAIDAVNSKMAEKADSASLQRTNAALDARALKSEMEELSRSVSTKADDATVAGKASKDELGAAIEAVNSKMAEKADSASLQRTNAALDARALKSEMEALSKNVAAKAEAALVDALKKKFDLEVERIVSEFTSSQTKAINGTHKLVAELNEAFTTHMNKIAEVTGSQANAIAQDVVQLNIFRTNLALKANQADVDLQFATIREEIQRKIQLALMNLEVNQKLVHSTSKIGIDSAADQRMTASLRQLPPNPSDFERRLSEMEARLTSVEVEGRFHTQAMRELRALQSYAANHLGAFRVLLRQIRAESVHVVTRNRFDECISAEMRSYNRPHSPMRISLDSPPKHTAASTSPPKTNGGFSSTSKGTSAPSTSTSILSLLVDSNATSPPKPNGASASTASAHH